MDAEPVTLEPIELGTCLLRQWQKSDKPSLVRYANNPNVSRHLREIFPHPYTELDAEKWLANAPFGRAARWRYAIDVGGEAVGGIGLDPYRDIERHTVEVGYWLGEPFWGRGILTGAVRVIAARALATSDIYRVCARVSAGNPASIRVLEKAGFSREGVLLRASVKSGVVFDELVFGLTRDPGLPYVRFQR
jgi:ribosomal-protein-alanine N-acetyltransferase